MIQDGCLLDQLKARHQIKELEVRLYSQ